MSQSSIPESDHRGQQSAPVVSGPTFNWPKALLVRRLIKQNTWHADVSFAAEPTDAELDALGAFLRDYHKHVRAVNSHEALVKALEFIRDGYDNQDVNHVDFRVKAYQVALDALTSYREVQP